MNFQELHSLIEKEQPNICQVVAVKDGKTVLNDTWNNYSVSDTVHTMSVTKSIVSILVGIAIDKGLIESIDQKVLDFFPDYTVKRGEKTIYDVTLRHLLTMTAPYKYKSEPWTKVCTQNDWTVAALDLLGGRSGITGDFKYSTLGIHILNGIISAKSGMTTVDFANKYLFSPLEIKDRHIYVAPDAEAHKNFTISRSPKGSIWFSDPMGVGTAGYGLCLSAEEMAKIGVLCLNMGQRNGIQLISPERIHEMSKVRIQCNGNFRGMKYGYLWWIIDESEGIYAAIGNSGNVIYVDPKRNTTVAVSAYFKPTVFDRIDFIRDKIIPLID